MGAGRITREETVKWNQMTALRFQTWGRHQTSPASLRGSQDKLLLFSLSFYVSFTMVALTDNSNSPDSDMQEDLGDEGMADGVDTVTCHTFTKERQLLVRTIVPSA